MSHHKNDSEAENDSSAEFASEGRRAFDLYYRIAFWALSALIAFVIWEYNSHNASDAKKFDAIEIRLQKLDEDKLDERIYLRDIQDIKIKLDQLYALQFQANEGNGSKKHNGGK